MTATLFDRNAEILVLGDIMLDGYASGGVERISPEAPVPVLHHLSHHEVPGGGANVAMNIAALGAHAHLVGLVGADDEAKRLGGLLQAVGIRTHFVEADNRPTTFKLRILAGNHQMLRIDKEDASPAELSLEKALISQVEALLPKVKALVLSDYRKGCLTDRVLLAAIGLANAQGVPVFVDPKRSDFTAYRGANFITPNRSELKAATGVACLTDGDCERAAEAAIQASGAAILLTRSEQGMTFFPAQGEAIWLPTEAQEVFDVSGAGDSVIATFALGVVSGLPIPQALRAANCAAGLVISKAGTATTTEAEIVAALERAHASRPETGAVAWDKARIQREAWRAEKLTVGFTNGCFDLLHPGHIALLREAAMQCDRLIVGINSDASVSRLKGPTRPIQQAEARAEVMAAISHVDMVVVFEEDTPYALIDALSPDILVKGSDYEEHQIVGADLVKARGGSIVRVDLRRGHSTSNLVARSSQPTSVLQPAIAS
jgi:D-beta-D-heptose 7-phosphate kinase/D-beta-D-heptose 1-phosphate adenosyltransferase